jgi:uncharacterized repeat protein (TIGR03943 family)
VNREAQGGVLFLLGGAVLFAALTDLHLRYVKAGLRPLLLVAGAVLIVAATVTIWHEWRRPHAAKADQPEHEHREPRVSWLLLLPMLALVLVAPPPPGSYSAMRTGTALQERSGFPALPGGDPLQLGLVDYAGRAAYDHGRSLGDRQITTTGFISLDDSGAPFLVRMVLNCCAADAEPVKIGLTGQIPPILQPDTWFEITGTYTDQQTRDPVNDRVIPFINVVQARPVPAPPDQYDSLY